MKFCKQADIIKRNNADNCAVSEYPTEDQDLDFAIVRVDGRYPENGFAVNRKVKEIVYVSEGSGLVVVNDQRFDLDQGDVILINPGELFYWQGHYTLHIACNPAFTPEQHQHVNDQ